MTDSTESELEEGKAAYLFWQETYEITDYIDNSPENWEKVQQMDPHFLWTDHSTCESDCVSNGAMNFEGSCCWMSAGWHVAKKPWPDQENYFESYSTNIYLPCEKCNPGGEEDEDDFDEDCEDCEGEGHVRHYFD